MRTAYAVLSVAVCSAFLTLSWPAGLAPAAAQSPAVVQYHCPMHPSYIQDHKADCPICGMKLVPVKPAAKPAGSSGGAPAAAAAQPARAGQYTCPMHPAIVQDGEGRCPTCGMKLERVAGPGPGAMAVDADKQKVLGIATSPAERSAGARTLRVLGRVAPDEARLYKVNAGVGGSMRDVSPVATGSRVKRNQVLGSYYAPDALTVMQLFIMNMQGYDRLQIEKHKADGSLNGEGRTEDDKGVGKKSGGALYQANIQQRVMQLENYGVSELQREEMVRAGRVPDTIKIVSPAEGFVLARGVFPGLKFDRGFEFYRIADLRKVWVLADVFMQDARHVRVGMRAEVSSPEQKVTLPATVTEILPQFDAATRTLKVKLALDNPGFVLRPDMFVDVAVKIELPSGVVVPSDAIVDSGLVKRVFVQSAEGVFEPRVVETGWRSGDQVEVVKGLRPGELVVTSGTFFLDSETRMRPPASGAAAASDVPVPTGQRSRGGAGVVEARASAAGEEGRHGHAGDAR
jgi:membrane fusion protein, copper/silver efflux system